MHVVCVQVYDAPFKMLKTILFGHIFDAHQVFFISFSIRSFVRLIAKVLAAGVPKTSLYFIQTLIIGIR